MHDQMGQNAVEKLIASISDLHVFQILNIMNVKKIGNVWTLPFKQSALKTYDQRNDKWAS